MFRPIARVTVIPLALAMLTVLPLFASVLGQEQVPSAETAAAAPQNAPIAASVSRRTSWSIRSWPKRSSIPRSGRCFSPGISPG